MSLKDKYFPVLDHGFIALKDIMGTDADIEQAARTSYGKGTRKKSETRGLIRYLMRGKNGIRHTSPFEMVEFKFHVRVPMDCWRQWIRHRTASVNEYSTRYSEAIDFRQETDPDKWRTQSKDNKQGSGTFLVEEDGGAYCGKVLSDEEKYLHKLSNRVYQHRLEAGVAREQARKDLPLSTYTEAYWKIDLHNLLHLMSLRCDKDAQYEIRQYANIIAGIVEQECPITYEAWEDYVFGAVTFSRLEMNLLFYFTGHLAAGRKIADNDIIEHAKHIGMGKREANEFMEKMTPINKKIPPLDLSLAKPYSYFQEKDDEKNNQMAQSTS